jgi:hypothetical protein
MQEIELLRREFQQSPEPAIASLIAESIQIERRLA